MSAMWKFFVEFASTISALTAAAALALAYFNTARRLYLWPFQPRLPRPLRAELRRVLCETTRINPRTTVNLRFVETDGARLWLAIEFRQSMTNLSSSAQAIRCRFAANGRPHRKLSIRLNSRSIVPSKDTESEIVVASDIPPGDTVELEMAYEMAYHTLDSEVLVSYRAGSEFHFSAVDEVSEAAGRRRFVLEVEPLFTRVPGRALDFDLVGAHPYSQRLSVTGGFTPFSGVYVKWRPVL